MTQKACFFLLPSTVGRQAYTATRCDFYCCAERRGLVSEEHPKCTPWIGVQTGDSDLLLLAQSVAVTGAQVLTKATGTITA